MGKSELSWKVGFTNSINGEPEEMILAKVPGSVQQDYAKFKSMEPFYKGVNYKDYKWMEDVFWDYKTSTFLEISPDQIAILHFEGIDYRYRIIVNGKIMCEDEGMFHPIDIDISEFANQEITIEVRLYPIPKMDDSDSRNQAAESCKSDACYGWDWHPRLVSTGIWNDAFIDIKSKKAISGFDVNYRLSDDLNSCKVFVDLKTTLDSHVKAKIIQKDRVICENVQETIVQSAKFEFIVEKPELWYPIGYGKQNMYKIVVETVDENEQVCDMMSKNIGFRRSKMVMNEGSWDEPSEFPKSRSAAPATLEINGRRLFAKGSNWVNAQVFPSDMTEENYRELLTLVKEANMNILRIWGGGFVNKESFYDICDEFGIMVWQEFPLACNEYPDKEEYLAVLEKEATAIVKRLRIHPCIVLWCGGNELFNSWSNMTDQHHALRLLDSICYREDRFTPFIFTSPLNGMGHGHYVNYDDDIKKEAIELYRNSKNTAYTEFGSPGVAMPEVLRSFMSEKDYNDFNPCNEIWTAHHAFGAWGEDNWARINEVEYFYGGYADVDDLSLKTNAIQSMCYKSYFEEMRRQWPHCSMALNWCLNEPWPTAANNSIISWPVIAKPAYYAVKDSLRTRMASLDIAYHLWHGGDIFRGTVWMLNDSVSILEAGEISVSYVIDGKETCCGVFYYQGIPEQSNVECGTVAFAIPQGYNGNVIVKLTVEGNEEYSSSYTYPCRSEEKNKPIVPILNM